MPNTESQGRSPTLRSVLVSALKLLLIYVALFVFVGDTRKVVSGSMEPTLRVGERLLVGKLPFPRRVLGFDIPGWRLPHHGEIVTFKVAPLGSTLVKRVIGLPGDIVSMRDGSLCVNTWSLELHGLEEPVFPVADMNNWGPFRVPEASLFLLGDNRDNSADSRLFGFVPANQVRGTVLAIYFSHDGTGIRWDRMFRGAEEHPRMGASGAGHLPWNDDGSCTRAAVTP